MIMLIQYITLCITSLDKVFTYQNFGLLSISRIKIFLVLNNTKTMVLSLFLILTVILLKHIIGFSHSNKEVPKYQI